MHMWMEAEAERNWITPITYWARTMRWPRTVLRVSHTRPHSTLIRALWGRSTTILILQMRHPRLRKVKRDVWGHRGLKCQARTGIEGAWLTSQTNRLGSWVKRQKGRWGSKAAWMGKRRGGTRQRHTWGDRRGKNRSTMALLVLGADSGAEVAVLSRRTWTWGHAAGPLFNVLTPWLSHGL